MTKGNIQKLNDLLINICTLCIVFNVLFLLSGDIELNPGPVSVEALSDASSSNYTLHNCSDILNSKLNLSLVHLNIRSLLPKLDHLSVELQNYDIVALTETFLDDTISNEKLHIPGFQNPIRRDRNRHGGGVAIYCKNEIAATRCERFEKMEIEGIWIKINLNNNFIYLSCLYRPPSENGNFWDILNENISLIKEGGDDAFFIVGDLNGDRSIFRSPIGTKPL